MTWDKSGRYMKKAVHPFVLNPKRENSCAICFKSREQHRQPDESDRLLRELRKEDPDFWEAMKQSR